MKNKERLIFRSLFDEDVVNITTSNVMDGFIKAKAMEVSEILVTNEEYQVFLNYFGNWLPYNWSNDKIWGIKLTILKSSYNSFGAFPSKELDEIKKIK